jgi:SDR family mycofactocin-dependent oxidoreductase
MIPALGRRAKQEGPMGKLAGKVAFITGAGRGQGRSHAVRLAQEGADIIALDICADIRTVPYPLSTADDLAETARQVRALDQGVATFAADVRDFDALAAAVADGVAQVGPIDIVLANAGIAPFSMSPTEEEWTDVIDVNLTGVYNTVRAVLPQMIERGSGGSIVLTSSVAGLVGGGGNTPGGLGYTAAKHAVVGLMRSYANDLAPHNIRVNTVNPTAVRTPMVANDAIEAYVRSDRSLGRAANALPVPMIEPIDVSNAIAWLVSDDARYVTGVALPVDAGSVNKR